MDKARRGAGVREAGGTVVVGWGDRRASGREERMIELLGRPLYCFGFTPQRQPALPHPPSSCAPTHLCSNSCHSISAAAVEMVCWRTLFRSPSRDACGALPPELADQHEPVFRGCSRRAPAPTGIAGVAASNWTASRKRYRSGVPIRVSTAPIPRRIRAERRGWGCRQAPRSPGPTDTGSTRAPHSARRSISTSARPAGCGSVLWNTVPWCRCQP